MASYWQVGEDRLDDAQVPFAVGTDEYYRYIAAWRAKQLGVSYGPADSLGAEGVGGDERKSYQDGLKAWWQAQYEQARRDDRRGQDALGYGRDAGGYYRDLNGDGQRNADEQYGKAQNGVAASNNRWNDVWGKDVRTDDQKYYDRETSNWQQTADANGTYSWYADWTYADNQGQQQKKRINLSAIGERDQAGKGYATDEYSRYNDAPDEGWFAQQQRERKNLSTYSRTA